MQRELGCIFVMSRLVLEMTVLHEGKRLYLRNLKIIETINSTHSNILTLQSSQK